MQRQFARNAKHNENGLKTLTLSMLGKNFSRRNFEISFYRSYFCFPGNRLWHFMQIVSLEDDLHEMTKPFLWEK